MRMLGSPKGEDDNKIRKDEKDVEGSNLTYVAGVLLPFYNRDDVCVPEYMKGNPYIFTGYRARYTTSMCFRSLFALHNETINVWSHGVGLILFGVLSIVVFDALLFTHAEFAHYFIYGTFCFACMMCMGCSSIYHLFLGHENSLLSSLMEQLDYYGISVLIVASFLPPLYIGFYCEPLFQALYMGCACFFGGLCLAMAALPSLRDAKFHWLRIMTYVATVMCGLVPTVHYVFSTPHNAETMQTFVGVFLMFLFYGMGVLFYCLRIPERFYPGEFDFFLNSHQIWHVFVLVAACVHFFTCISIYQKWVLSKGAC
ncbi:hypothetical protein TCDM_03525 [Trypanosoma cruzi Dm28c]|uniref:Adiponectin receptor protein 1 n=2 Tax=Trypanosoma cruzi TaxID=5693 RepID=V5BJ57_TRYCR|nr:hypothetical protein TCDM_03525 [Trypanosoma cruzi Dm28c]PBJ75410.1 hypothetical protein BCY84_11237 [Trypanosoma cruzi cruzi]PWU97770.1 hypothetical protein C4B63_14g110 [Trypanosoma cruzi]